MTTPLDRFNEALWAYAKVLERLEEAHVKYGPESHEAIEARYDAHALRLALHEAADRALDEADESAKG